MNLFEKIPDNFFSILSSKNKNIYGIALVTLYEALTMYRNRIRKSDFLELLKSRGEQVVSLLTFEDEDEFENNYVYEPTLAQKANYIFRRLIDTGWIYLDQNIKTGTEYILLPTYSISMLKIIYEFMNANETKYVSYVHSTYSDLKLEDDVQDEFMYKTLESAYYNTRNLEIEVAKLDHSIKVFQRQLNNIFSPNEVLSQHFDDCREDVVNPIYHPLKTSDSIVLYQGPINAILKRWLLTDSVRNKLIDQLLRDNRTIKTQEEAESNIVKMINYIQDTYLRLTNEIGEIDKTQSDYIKASTEKVIYLNNSDKSIRGKLETIFLAVAKTLAGESEGTYKSIVRDLTNSALFYQQGFIDSDSVAKPYKRNPRDEGVPLELDDFYQIRNSDLINDIMDRSKAYSEETIMAYMKKAFGDKQELYAKDISLDNVNDFIMLILGSVKSNSPISFYEIDHVEEGNKQIDNGEYNIPDFTYRKKGDN